MDCHPTEDVGFFVTCNIGAVRRDDVVGRLPAEAAGNVCQLCVEVIRGPGIDLPAQRRFQEHSVGCGRKQRRSGQLELHLAVDFNQRLSILTADHLPVEGVLLRAIVAGANDLALYDPRSRSTKNLKIDGLSLILLQQPFLAHDGGVVVLLDHMDHTFARGVTQDDGVGLQAAGDAVGRDLVDAGMQIEIQKRAGDREVLVVDGECNRLLFLRLSEHRGA